MLISSVYPEHLIENKLYEYPAGSYLQYLGVQGGDIYKFHILDSDKTVYTKFDCSSLAYLILEDKLAAKKKIYLWNLFSITDTELQSKLRDGEAS